MNMHANTEPIRSIILYGSVARGDSDPRSDVDVLVVVSEPAPTPTENVLRKLAPSLPIQSLDVSVYTESDLQAMLDSGSLFAWHVKLEGKVFFGEPYLLNKMKRLRPFQRHCEELNGYKDILEDLVKDYSQYKIPNEFDLSVVFTTVVLPLKDLEFPDLG